jgi:hypothetical protein
MKNPFKGLTMKNAAFFFILICAIAVSFWGISALLLLAGAHLAIALAGGIVFDALALWLGHEAVEVALSDESATGLEMITYLVVGTSMYLNWLHASMEGMTYPLPYVMALFPLAAGILFHFYLKRQSKKARREQNRMVNRNPVLGKMTAVRFPIKSFKMWSKSVKTNLARAQHELPVYGEIEQAVIKADATLGQPEKAPKNKIEKPKPLPQLAPAMQSETISEPLATPVVEAKEEFKFGFQATPTFTATSVRGKAFEAFGMGYDNPEQVAEWIGTDKLTVQKHFSAARKQ